MAIPTGPCQDEWGVLEELDEGKLHPLPQNLPYDTDRFMQCPSFTLAFQRYPDKPADIVIKPPMLTERAKLHDIAIFYRYRTFKGKIEQRLAKVFKQSSPQNVYRCENFFGGCWYFATVRSPTLYTHASNRCPIYLSNYLYLPFDPKVDSIRDVLVYKDDSKWSVYYKNPLSPVKSIILTFQGHRCETFGMMTGGRTTNDQYRCATIDDPQSSFDNVVFNFKRLGDGWLRDFELLSLVNARAESECVARPEVAISKEIVVLPEKTETEPMPDMSDAESRKQPPGPQRIITMSLFHDALRKSRTPPMASKDIGPLVDSLNDVITGTLYRSKQGQPEFKRRKPGSGGGGVQQAQRSAEPRAAWPSHHSPPPPPAVFQPQSYYSLGARYTTHH